MGHEPFRAFVRQLVGLVADEWQESNGVKVLAEAREALVEPALPHADAVMSALHSGTKSVSQLENDVQEILRNASRFGAGDIDAAMIAASMRYHCPYLFWC